MSELLQNKLYPCFKSVCPWSLAQFWGTALSCQSKLLNHLSSKTILLTLQVKCVFHLPRWWSVYWSWFIEAHLFYCLSWVNRIVTVFWSSTTENIPQTVIPQGFFSAGHIRRTVNSAAALIPHFTLLPLVFVSTKDVLVSRSSAISALLSSAKHKFTAHSCTVWGFLLLQQGGINTELFCSGRRSVEWVLQKDSTPHVHTYLIYSYQSSSVLGSSPICSLFSAQHVHKVYSYEAALRQNRALS